MLLALLPASAALPQIVTPGFGLPGSPQLRGALGGFPDSMAGGQRVHLLLPRLGGETFQDAVPVFERGGEIYVPVRFLREAGFAGGGQVLMERGMAFRAISSVDGLYGVLALQDGYLELRCEGGCFGETRISGARQDTGLDPLETQGGFFNYDALLQTGSTGTGWGVFGEAGVFAGPGTAVSGFSCSGGPGRAGCTRLETAFVQDDPAAMTRLTLGDTFTQPGLAGAPVRFGGVKWGTDFSLRPGFVPFPSPDFTGYAELPSAADVYINGARRFQARVPAGPFQVTDVPALQGAGEARLVLRDTLGRERVIVTDYYASPSLLKPGLDVFSIEAGVLRKDYARASNAYGEAFAGGFYRRGLSGWLTAEARGEAGETGPSGGLGLSAAHPSFGAVSFGVASSRREGRTGFLGHAVYEWRAAPFSAVFGAEIADSGFRLFGAPSGRVLPRTALRGQLALNSEKGETLALSWLSRDERPGMEAARPDFQSLGLSLSGPAGRGSYRLSVMRLFAPEPSVVAGLTLAFPLGGRRSAGAAFEHDGAELGWETRLRQDAPLAGGIGAYARFGRRDSGRQEAGLDLRSSIGDLAVAGARVNGLSALRLSARGALVSAGGEAALARPVTDGFAIVQTGGQEGVRVYQDRRLAGRTDAKGRLVITSLRAYDENRLSFDPRDLPLRASFGETEKKVVPRYRAGYRISFAAQGAPGAVLRLHSPGGAPFPEGSLVRLAGQREALPVGTGGRLYLGEAPEQGRLLFETDQGICAVMLPRAATPVQGHADLGEVTCLQTEGDE